MLRETKTTCNKASLVRKMYPKGMTPKGYNNKESGVVPIYSVPAKIDDLLEARKASCAKKLLSDVKNWDNNYGKKLIKQEKYQKIIKILANKCKNNKLLTETFPIIGDNIKDISDSITFDYYSHYNIILNINELNILRELATKILFGRLYSTNEQQVYMSGSLPSYILKSFEANAAGQNNNKFQIFHGHREMIYAIGYYFGFNFNQLENVAIPKGAIPQATTIFFELHEYKKQINNPNKQYYVKTILFRPTDSCPIKSH